MATIKNTEIKRLRKSMGLTQAELAKKCDVTQSYINKVEKGKTIPTIPFLQELGKIFKVNFKDLI